jgi:hypothetical protein
MGATGWIIIVVVVVGVIFAAFGWDRYRGSRKSGGDGPGPKPTTEVFIDPSTGQRMRVWYDSKTGDREYRPEDTGA